MEHLLLALLISGLGGPSSALSRHYYFVNENRTWSEAQRYCRENYTDLATVDNMEEMVQLKAAVDPTYSGALWIGLYKASQRRWGWSSGEIAQYVKWRSGEPNGGDRDGLCAARIVSDGWVDALCTESFEFVCYSEPTKQFIPIKNPDTWRNAQAYCRKHYTDLATVHNEQEHQTISGLLTEPYTWIGLFFDNWKWSDRRSSTFRYWMEGQPWSPTGKANCAAMVTSWKGQWNDSKCNEKIPFMCYKALRQRIMKLTVTTSGKKDLNDPAVKTTIMSQVEKHWRAQQGTADSTLKWREKNGEVFSLRKKRTTEDQQCGKRNVGHVYEPQAIKLQIKAKSPSAKSAN